jgi:hypothetical protein
MHIIDNYIGWLSTEFIQMIGPFDNFDRLLRVDPNPVMTLTGHDPDRS